MNIPQNQEKADYKKKRLEAVSANAAHRREITAIDVTHRDDTYFQRHTHVPAAPIFIASSEDIGTNRVRANHVDAAIDYCVEQEKLKLAGAPI